MINNLTTREIDASNPARCTGRTTCLALEYIAKCFKEPDKWIKVVDHHDSKDQNRYLLTRIMDMVEQLNLAYFKYDTINNTVTFNLYT